jgi:FtsP/CotA-like multicopper oxidase with cupredoxin domain
VRKLYPLLLVVLLLISAQLTKASTDTLYINRGSFITVKKTSFPAFAINANAVFDRHATTISVALGEPLTLLIVNNDSIVHGFSVMGFPGQTKIIQPGANVTIQLDIQTEGIYFCYDHQNYPTNAYLGAVAMIVATKSTYRSFYWNIREYQSLLNDSLIKGGTFHKETYDPDYFTINGLSYPDIQNDTTAHITGSLGDTIRIYLANTGQSLHSIHFHGFHTKCLFSTSPTLPIGWRKDTWAVRPMTAMALELVVDKAGKYSVHDHNLVAVSASGTHPNGMFTIMEFK